MIVACYLGSAVFAGAAAWGWKKANTNEKMADQLQSGINNKLPEKDGETTYASIVCRRFRNKELTLLPPDGKQVLLGRITFVDSTENVGIGYGPAFGSSGTSVAVTATTTTSKHKEKFGFPEQAILTSDHGDVVANNPDLAIWDGAEQDTNKCHPDRVAALLRKLGSRANHGAGNYKVRRKWFADGAVTFFANVTRKRAGFVINSPEGEMPFVVTSKSPTVYVGGVRAKAANFRQGSKVCILASAILGTFALQQNGVVIKKWLHF